MSTWLHCSWWGCLVFQTHTGKHIHPEPLHHPLQWLSLCVLCCSGMSTLSTQGRQRQGFDHLPMSYCVSSLGQWEQHHVYTLGWVGLNSLLEAPERHWRQLWLWGVQKQGVNSTQSVMKACHIPSWWLNKVYSKHLMHVIQIVLLNGIPLHACTHYYFMQVYEHNN